MMRLPSFRYLGPRDLATAARMLSDNGPGAQVVSGGTDLFPNMKRRQQTPAVVIGLRAVAALEERRVNGGLILGAGRTLTALEEDPIVAERYGALHRAVASVATPHLRNMGTLGGNICLDTRCNYYDQNYEWRKSIDFCMKKDGGVCWVAPGSPRCWAVSSSDSAPALVALGARFHLSSANGERVVPAGDFYRDDGIAYLSKRADEILVSVELPESRGWHSTYLKLRRRGAFDFPVLSVAVALKMDTARDPIVEAASIVLGAVGSKPVAAPAAAARLTGRRLSDDAIDEAAGEAARLAKPLDNTDYALGWRKRVARQFVAGALRQLRGDGPSRLPTGALPVLG